MLELSPLAKTWILDVDGTIVRHNGHLNGGDVLLDGVKEFFVTIGEHDMVILLTSREKQFIPDLEQFLKSNNIRFDYIICDLPFGERILINDNKASGLKTAYAVSKERDSNLNINYQINERL